MSLTTRIVSMLAPMIPHQRKYAIREEQIDMARPSSFSLDSEVPFP